MVRKNKNEVIPSVGSTLSNDATGVRDRLDPETERLMAASLAPNTLRAIRADLRVFLGAGGRLPSTGAEVANFLSSQLKKKRPSTIERYASSIHTWHRLQGYDSPVHTVSVRQTLQGIRRTEDTRPKGAPALSYDDLKRLIDSAPDSGLKAVQNRAMIALGFHGAFRRSELVGLLVEDLDFHREGVIVSLRKSKTNQHGRVEEKPIRRLSKSPDYCPVALLEVWLEESGLTHGPLFPGVRKGNQLNGKAISAETFYRKVQDAAQAAGLRDVGYSPHSLRAGYVTEAYRRGANFIEIKRVSGHRHQPTLERYIRLSPFEGGENLFD